MKWRKTISDITFVLIIALTVIVCVCIIFDEKYMALHGVAALACSYILNMYIDNKHL
jgi:hypothetical protein